MRKFLLCIIIALISGILGYSAALNKIKPKPVLTTAGIVHICPENKIALIERGKKPMGLAMFGGHVEYNESPEKAFMRELMEELNISEVKNLKLVGVHGEKDRDPRQHSVEVTYSCITNQKPKAGSDAKAVKLYDITEIMDLPKSKFAFDHAEILQNYINHLDGCNPCQSLCH